MSELERLKAENGALWEAIRHYQAALEYVEWPDEDWMGSEASFHGHYRCAKSAVERTENL